MVIVGICAARGVRTARLRPNGSLGARQSAAESTNKTGAYSRNTLSLHEESAVKTGDGQSAEAIKEFEPDSVISLK
jgi:hypothetical protein